MFNFMMIPTYNFLKCFLLTIVRIVLIIRIMQETEMSKFMYNVLDTPCVWQTRVYNPEDTAMDLKNVDLRPSQ